MKYYILDIAGMALFKTSDMKNAVPTDNMSFIKKGSDTSKNDSVKDEAVIIENCKEPKLWHINKPNIPPEMASIAFLSAAYPHTKAIAIKPHRKPPVIPNKAPIPILKPLNTGKPITPKKI